MAVEKSTLHRYLLGAMQQLEISMTIRFQGTPAEVKRIPEIMEAWREASTRMQTLSKEDAGFPQRIATQDPPRELLPRLQEIAKGPLFQASFSDLPSTFKVVEIDKLVAPQRQVNLDYVSNVRSRLRGKSLADLVEFCLAPRSEAPPVKTLQTAPNQVVFSSPSLDLRFLGGFPKPIGEEDLKAAYLGGQPVEVLALLIGFSAAPINAWMVGGRLVLANGFHRVFALRQEGITHVPIVVRQVANPEIEFPEQFLGLSRSYLIQSPRPVVVKDFFDNELTAEIRMKPRIKTLKITWIPEEGVVAE